jgi:MFS family permease
VIACRLHYALVVLAGCSLAIMGALGLGRLAYPVILPVMQPGLGLSSAQSGLLASASLVGYLLASIGGGILAARYGARRTLAGGLGTAALGLLLTGLSPSLGVALLGQFVNGLGAGAATIPSMGLAATWFGPALRGRASGVVSSGAGPGMLLAGLLLPWLMHGTDWRAGWHALAALVLLAALGCWLLVRNTPAELGLEPMGDAARYAGTSASGRPPTLSRPTEGPTTNSRSSVAASPRPPVAASLSAASPLRTPLFLHFGITFLMFGVGFTSYGTFFPAYLVREAGFSQAAAGAVWGVSGTLGTLGALLWGAVSDWIGRRAALVWVFGLFCAAFFSSALAPGPLGYYLAPVLFGVCAWAVPTIISAAIGDYFEHGRLYQSMGLITAFSATGQGLGPSLGGLAADLAGSLSAAFFLAAAAGLTGLTLSLLLPRPPLSTSAAPSPRAH